MESLLLLAAWMSIGAVCALRFGPSGAVPIAVIFGPLWPAIVEDMKPQAVEARVGIGGGGSEI